MTSPEPPLLIREPTLPKQARPRLEFIDALRAFACFSVLLVHSFGGQPVRPGLAHLPLRMFIGISNLGYLGVGLFLVLSGFCLYYPIARKTEPPGARVDLKTFAARRARRILPPYYAALAFSAAVLVYRARHHHQPLLSGFAGWYDLPLHLVMLQNLFVATFNSLNGTFWTLGLECQCYVLFPALVWLAARRGFGAVALLTGAVAVAWQTAVFCKFGPTDSWADPQVTYYSAPLGRCFEFVLGMWAAELLNRPVPSQGRIAAALMLISWPLGICYDCFISRFGPFHDQIWGLVFVSWVIILGQVPGTWFHANRVLRALAVVGTFSYSVYLIHFPLISLLYEGSLHLKRFTESDAGDVIFGLGRIVVICGLGYLFFLVAERPFVTRPATAKPVPAKLPSSPAARKKSL